MSHALSGLHGLARTIVPMVVVATLLCFYLGPTGILYALGFEVILLLIYRLTVALAGLLDPDVY